MHYSITHTTEYIYDEPVSLCHNIARLVPRSTPRQHCKRSVVRIHPEPDVLNEYEDFFGNKVLYFAIQQEHQKLSVTVLSDIEVATTAALNLELYKKIPWEEVKLQLQQVRPEFAGVQQYIPGTAMTAINSDVLAYTLQSFTPGRPMFEAASHLMQRIYTDFTFTPGFTTIATPVAEVLQQRQGVCQDFAHLAIACIRSVGLAARYVSGYIETLPAPGAEKLVGVDASHAWFSVFFPDGDWIDFDPTNNQMPAGRHITVGWGRDYSDVTPLKGVIQSSGPHQLAVSVDVRRAG